MMRELNKREKPFLFKGSCPRRMQENIDYRKRVVLKEKTNYFLSHAWGNDGLGRDNHHRVVSVGKLLMKAGFRVFLDEDNMTGEIKNTMALAISETDVFLVFLTERYVDRIEDDMENNCKFEWRSASNHRKIFYPIVMEEKLLDSSAWGNLVNSKCDSSIKSDFSDDLMLNSCIEKILSDTSSFISVKS